MFSFGKAYPEEEYSALDTTTGKHSDAAHAACDLGDLETRRQVTVESSEDLEVVAAVAGSAALAAAVVGAPPHRAALAVEIALREKALISPQFATYVLVACTATRISLSLGGSPEDASSAVRRAVKQAGADHRRCSVAPVYDISDGDSGSGNNESCNASEYCPEVTQSRGKASSSKFSGAARSISDGIAESTAADTCSDVDHNDSNQALWNETQALWNDTAGPSHITSIHEDRNEHSDLEEFLHSDLEEFLCRYLAPPTEMSDRPMTSDPFIFTPPVSPRSQRQELVDELCKNAYEDPYRAIGCHDGSSPVDVTFRGCQHGLKFGLNFDPSTGTVASVKPDSQSGLAGVKRDWVMIKINGDAYTSHKLRECASQRGDFVITFLPAPEPQVPLKNLADMQLMAADTRVRADLPTTNDGRSFRYAGRPAVTQTLAPESLSRSKATIAYVSGDGDSSVWAKFLHGVVTQEASSTVANNADSTRDLDDVRPTCTRDPAGVAEVRSGIPVQTTSEFNLAMLLTALPHITGNEVDRDPVPLDLMQEFGSCITLRSRGVAVETLCMQLKRAFARVGCNITCEVAEHLIRGKCDLFEAYIAMRSANQPQTPEQLFHL